MILDGGIVVQLPNPHTHCSFPKLQGRKGKLPDGILLPGTVFGAQRLGLSA
jgi:hypothetical protein